MQAKPPYPRRPARSVKSVAFLAMTMAMALISAVLIVYNLAKAADPDPLSGISSSQTQTVLLLTHEGGLIDDSLLDNPAAAKDQATDWRTGHKYPEPACKRWFAHPANPAPNENNCRG